MTSEEKSKMSLRYNDRVSRIIRQTGELDPVFILLDILMILAGIMKSNILWGS